MKNLNFFIKHIHQLAAIVMFIFLAIRFNYVSVKVVFLCLIVIIYALLSYIGIILEEIKDKIK
jgi:hypothetical protein